MDYLEKRVTEETVSRIFLNGVLGLIWALNFFPKIYVVYIHTNIN